MAASAQQAPPLAPMAATSYYIRRATFFLFNSKLLVGTFLEDICAIFHMIIAVDSLNGHIQRPPGMIFRSCWVEESWFVICWQQGTAQSAPDFLHLYYNQEGREVFRVAVAKEQKCSFKSFVASVITRLVGRRKTSTGTT